MWICAVDATDSLPVVTCGKSGKNEPAFRRVCHSVHALQQGMNEQELEQEFLREDWRDWLEAMKKEAPLTFPRESEEDVFWIIGVPDVWYGKKELMAAAGRLFSGAGFEHAVILPRTLGLLETAVREYGLEPCMKSETGLLLMEMENYFFRAFYFRKGKMRSWQGPVNRDPKEAIGRMLREISGLQEAAEKGSGAIPVIWSGDAAEEEGYLEALYAQMPGAEVYWYAEAPEDKKLTEGLASRRTEALWRIGPEMIPRAWLEKDILKLVFCEQQGVSLLQGVMNRSYNRLCGSFIEKTVKEMNRRLMKFAEQVVEQGFNALRYDFWAETPFLEWYRNTLPGWFEKQREKEWERLAHDMNAVSAEWLRERHLPEDLLRVTADTVKEAVRNRPDREWPIPVEAVIPFEQARACVKKLPNNTDKWLRELRYRGKKEKFHSQCSSVSNILRLNMNHWSRRPDILLQFAENQLFVILDAWSIRPPLKTEEIDPNSGADAGEDLGDRWKKAAERYLQKYVSPDAEAFFAEGYTEPWKTAYTHTAGKEEAP